MLGWSLDHLVAVAAAHAAAARLDGTRPPAAMVLDRLRSYLIEGALQRGIARAILNHYQCGQTNPPSRDEPRQAKP